MKKLSSDKTAFVKNVFPFIVLLFYLGFLILVVVEGLYIVLPIFLYFLIGLVISFRRSKKLIDFYVNYNSKEIIVDDTKGNKTRYQFSGLVTAIHKESRSEVRLKFSDGKSYIFLTRNLWRSPLIERLENVDDDISLIKSQRFVTDFNN